MGSALAVVDTNVISYIFKADSRGLPYKRILAEVRHPCISFQTLAELRYWAVHGDWGQRRWNDLLGYLERYTFISCDEGTCRTWAEIRASQQRAGRVICPGDAWIAATALDIRCPLVTHNAEDFQHIPGLRIVTAR